VTKKCASHVFSIPRPQKCGSWASAPVAACGILVVLGAPNSYNFIYSRFPFNGSIGAFPSEPRSALQVAAREVDEGIDAQERKLGISGRGEGQ
jgi:hypothetical protein